MTQYREQVKLSDEEISKLSLELKICYLVVPWNSLFKIETVEEWAEQVGVVWLVPEVGIDKAKEAAIEYIDHILEFYKRYILIGG